MQISLSFVTPLVRTEDGRVTVLTDIERAEFAGIEGAWHILDAIIPSRPVTARQVLLYSPKLVHWGDVKPLLFVDPGRCFCIGIPSSAAGQ